MRNITIAILESMYVNAANMWQWDYGQILRIQGKNIPKAVEVHFSLNEKGGDSITRIGTTIDGITDVPIPDTLLENNGAAQDYIIYAFVYLEDGESGNTEYKIRIPVKSRPKPEIPGTPEEPELFRETVKAVNAAADRAEQAEQNAKASATEAGKYATSASESAVVAEKTKEDALKEVGEKKQEAIEAIQKKEETSVGKIVNHTDDEIKRIQNQIAKSKGELEQTIENAGVSKEGLNKSIETASDTKTALDKSVELAGTAKTELDTSTQKAGEAKTALDGSARTAGEMQETLSATVKQAGALDTSLGEKIETGTQLKTDLTASGEKAVRDIQTAGSEQLGKMQAVAEEFTADREQITTNKEDIGSLKKDLSNKITKFYASNQGETHLADSDNGKIMDMMLYGRSEQKQYSGKNLLSPVLKSQTTGGITCVDNGNGTYTFTGTATNTVSFKVYGSAAESGEVLKEFTNKKLVGCPSGGGADKYFLRVSDNITYAYTDIGQGVKITTDIRHCYIRFIKGVTVSGLRFKPMVIDDLGATYDDFEPYTGGIPSPNPDYPQEIKSVVNPTVKVTNEDGLKVQSVTLNNITLNAIPVSSGGNVTIDGQQYIADYVDVERGKVVRMCKKEAVPNNCDWNIQKQSSGYKIGYSNKVFTDMETTQFNAIKKAISNLGNSSKIWSNNFCFGKSGVFWINPYTNNGELTVNDINNFLTDHPMEVTYLLKTPIEEELTTEQVQALKELSTYYPVTNITVGSEQLYGYTAFNYPISMENGWNYVKQQLNDNRDYIYDMDLQSAEAYVNSEYAVALTELEVM